MRVCIVTTAHVSDNPRVVKEADALAAAGHDVRVVAYDRWPATADEDRQLVQARCWRLVPVCVRPNGVSAARWLTWGLVSRAAEAAFTAGIRWQPVRDTALSKFHRPLARAAAREPADVVIAHHAPALPAAAAAAARLGARLAFDAEDLHAEDYFDADAQRCHLQLTAATEAAYLPRCDTITASSELIAIALADRYGVRRPAVVLNTFPMSERPVTPPRAINRTGRVPSLYWYSQVIGPGRGLEDVFEAMAMIERPVELHLRGRLDSAWRPSLSSMLERYGLEERVHIWPRANPADLLQLAMEHDIGLALEQPISLNRALCITNKLLLYLLAGLAVAATDTPGQRSVLASAPEAGFLYPPGDARALTQGLAALLDTPGRLEHAKQQALRAARQRYSWEYDAQRLLACIAPLERNAAEVASV